MPKPVSIVRNLVKGLVLAVAVTGGAISIAGDLQPVLALWNAEAPYIVGR